MKCKKTQYGIELIPENNFEIECLKHLFDHKPVSVVFEDNWNNTGNLIVQGKPHPWDN